MQEEFIQQFLTLCRKKKIEYVRILIEECEELKFELLDRNANNIVVANIIGIGVIINHLGKMGYAYTEDFSNPRYLLKKVLDNLIISKESIDDFDGCHVVYSQERRFVPLIDCSFEKKVEMANDLSDRVIEYSSGKAEVLSTSYSSKRKKIHFIDTRGKDIQHIYDTGYLYVHISYKHEEKKYSGLAYITCNQIIDIDKCAKDAITKACRCINAISPKTGLYNALINNDVMAKILQRIVPIFMGDKIDMGLSLIKEYDEKIILSSKLSIIDDPNILNNSLEYDEEGVKTRKKYIIKNGRLETILNNKNLSKKYKTYATGNGFYNGSSVGVAGVNIYIKEGEKSYDELMLYSPNKIIIYDISGLKSGIDISSGKFSLPAKGIVFDKGEIMNVEQFTISGNIFDLLNSIIAIGDDLHWGVPNKTNYGSPSILFSNLMITGTK